MHLPVAVVNAHFVNDGYNADHELLLIVTAYGCDVIDSEVLMTVVNSYLVHNSYNPLKEAFDSFHFVLLMTHCNVH